MSENLLYQYTSFESLLSILKTKVLFASDARYLNDSSEIEFGIGWVERRISERTQGTNESIKFITDIFRKQLDESRAYVACFSERGDWLSQWRAYCPDGGVSIAFDKRHLMQTTDQLKLEKCVYAADPSTERMYEPEVDDALAPLDEQIGFWHHYYTHSFGMGGSGLRATMGAFAIQVYRTAYRIKHEAFKEEQEWRLVGGYHAQNFGPPKDSQFNLSPKVRATIGGLKPFVEIPLTSHCGYWPENPHWHGLADIGVRRIIVGPHPYPKAMADAVKDALKDARVAIWPDKSDTYSFSDVPVVYSEIPYRQL